MPIAGIVAKFMLQSFGFYPRPFFARLLFLILSKGSPGFSPVVSLLTEFSQVRTNIRFLETHLVLAVLFASHILLFLPLYILLPSFSLIFSQLVTTWC